MTEESKTKTKTSTSASSDFFKSKISESGFSKYKNSSVDGTRTSDSNSSANDAANNKNFIMDIPVDVQIVLGSTVMPISNLLDLKRGQIIQLSSAIDAFVDVVVNGKKIAKGELVPLETDPTSFGVCLVEILNKQ